MDALDGACLSTSAKAGGKAGAGLPPSPLVVDPSSVSLSQPGDDLENEPCTQPLNDEDTDDVANLEESMEIDREKVHGYLLPFKPKGPMIPLEKDSFSVGRSVTTDHKIVDGKGKNKLKNFDAMSKVQFLLVKDKLGVHLEDRSSNGTFVNKQKVGKGKKVLLATNDSIGMTDGNQTHFVFIKADQENYPKELREKYTVSKELGKGACGTVVLGVRKSDSRQVAIKAINKKKVTMQPGSSLNVMNEVKLLRAIDHPCIIRLEDVVETEDELFIILELADGGELFDKIIEKTKLQEDEAKLHFYQMVHAIEYLHTKNIAHRDLKPENILLVSDDDLNPVIKVTDLGLSKFVDMDTHLKTFCGTPQYIAPEVLFSRVRGDGTYGIKVDMWSLGVILYVLLCGCPPFNPDNPNKGLIQQVCEADYRFPESLWGNISPEAIDLVKKLMTLKPERRLSAAETLMHPWMQDELIIKKAQELMNTQRKNSSSEANVLTANGGFKRPMTNELNIGATGGGGPGSACKRTKMSSD